jgi:hypothetical protein
MGAIAYAIVAFGIVMWVLPVPLTLVHELGHALPALAWSRERVVVRVGWQPNVSASLARLDVHVRFLNRPRWGWFGYFEVDWKAMRRWQAIVVTTGGPLVSLLILAALLTATTLVSWPATILVWVPTLAVAWQVLVTIIPVRYPAWFGPYAGWTSDGYRIRSLVRASES